MRFSERNRAVKTRPAATSVYTVTPRAAEPLGIVHDSSRKRTTPGPLKQSTFTGRMLPTVLTPYKTGAKGDTGAHLGLRLEQLDSWTAHHRSLTSVKLTLSV